MRRAAIVLDPARARRARCGARRCDAFHRYDPRVMRPSDLRRFGLHRATAGRDPLCRERSRAPRSATKRRLAPLLRGRRSGSSGEGLRRAAVNGQTN